MKPLRIVSCVVLLVALGCRSEPAMVRQMRKERGIDAIRQKILESVAAEKIAVLATTDEESTAAAQEVKRSEGEIDALRGELRQLITADQRRDEVEKLDAFDAAWAEVERVDSRLLALAVANTNLKATRLLSKEGAAALDRFVGGLTEMQGTISDSQMIRTLGRAAVAALRSQSLLFVHIPSADDAEMTRLEQQMRDLSAEVEQSLQSARDGHVDADRLQATALAWEDYQRLAAEVVKLSRQNTNVISVDVSVHEKRRSTKDCLTALAALESVVNPGPQATR